MSTGKWTAPDVPHFGWTCDDMIDLEASLAVCEMCEGRIIRYVHVMFHPHYPELLRCGCICAGHMGDDLGGARMREHELKRRQERRNRWLSRPWRLSGAGNEFVNVEGFNVVVFSRNGHWAVRVEDKATGYARFSQRPYATSEAAKLAAFDVIFHPRLGIKVQGGLGR